MGVMAKRENGEGEQRGRIERENGCYWRRQEADGGDHGEVDDSSDCCSATVAAAADAATTGEGVVATGLYTSYVAGVIWRWLQITR